MNWLAKTPDVVGVLNAVYGFEEPSLGGWLDRMIEAMAPSLPPHLGVVGSVVHDVGDGAEFIAVSPRAAEANDAARKSAGTPEFAGAMRTVAPVSYLASMIDAGNIGAAPAFLEDGHFRALPVDVFHLMCSADDATHVSIAVALGVRGQVMPPQLRGAWMSITAHIAAAGRLRLLTAPTKSVVLDTRFTVVDASDDSKSRAIRDAVRTAARAVDRVRGRRVRDPEEALAIWRVLAQGRWTIADDFDSTGRRYIVAYDNAPVPRVNLAGLTLAERQVTCFAVLGHSNKHIAYELGVAPSTVASRLSSAMRKLHVKSRASLVSALLRADDATPTN